MIDLDFKLSITEGKKELHIDGHVYGNYDYALQKLSMQENQPINWGLRHAKGTRLLSYVLLHQIYSGFAEQYHTEFTVFLRGLTSNKEHNFTSSDVDKWLKENIDSLKTIKVTIDRPKQDVSFENYEKLVKWHQLHESEYATILSLNHRRHPFTKLFDHMQQVIYSYQGAAIDHPDFQCGQKISSAINNYVIGDYAIDQKEPFFFLVNHRCFTAAKKMYADKPKVARIMLLYFMNVVEGYPDHPKHDSCFYEGVISAYLHNNEIKSSDDGLIVKIEKDIRDYTSSLDELKKINRDYKNMLINHKSILEKNINENEESYDKAFSKYTSDFKSDFDKIKKVYDADIQLQAPAKYWKKKACVHLCQYMAYLALTIASIGFLAYYLFLYFPNSVNLMNLMDIIRAITLSSLGIWAIRIFSKLFTSHHHLHTDASQKVVMMQVYLALVAKKKLDNASDKEYILNPLFQRTNDGMAGDINPHDFISMLKSINKK